MIADFAQFRVDLLHWTRLCVDTSEDIGFDVHRSQRACTYHRFMPGREFDAIENLPAPTFTNPRHVSVELHDHLRRLIIDARIPPGQVLKQAQLARVFGVSRTPTREAFRMLQEEGLIEADTNQRATVRHLDVNEVDQLYSVRILLESFGTRLTAGSISDTEIEQAKEHLRRMDEARDVADMDAWVHAHRAFHGVCVSRADEPLLRVIDSYSERTERYLRLYQVWHPQSFSIAHDEHEAILDAIVEGDRDAAASRMANHLARTSLSVLRDLSPNGDGFAVSQALALARARLPKTIVPPSR
ncbi:GntR family transcriptional regulator [Microbacterium sp. ARD31]|uniref:GntR family transcriptional regulator n=1 Tax=Microbacterium sp. ARD31 TaxID=2962576 RepID=UPI002882801D|nr:GntR family transcriptional regulator [Microbacterium sp. ARD31]MDT0183977.1 GntR family transcriptional regulator [Microbacterium sp. ARD31]